MFSIKGFISVLVTAAVLSVPLYYYWEFLTRGMRPSAPTLKLNDLEKNGIPEFSVNGFDGKELKLSDFKGKLLLVNIWATWCAPCVKEFPSMKGLVNALDGKVAVLAISYDKNREDIETFIKAFGGLPQDFVVAWDPERATSKIFGTEVLPETYILSAEGKLIRKVAGEVIWDEPSAIDFFKELVAGRDPLKIQSPPSAN